MCFCRHGSLSRRPRRIGREARSSPWLGEVWHVGSGRHNDANLLAVPGILIILFDPLANFCCGHPDNGVYVSVIVSRSAEDLHTNDALLKLICLTSQDVRHDKFEEAGIASAGDEKRSSE